MEVVDPGPERAGVEGAMRTTDGVGLVSRWHATPESRAVVVLVHGFAAGRDDAGVRALADDLIVSGLSVLTYDARGHGLSEGQCAVGSQEHLDVACAVQLAAAEGRPVVVVGVSMGAVATVNYLATDFGRSSRVGGAVLVSGPARWRMRASPLGVLLAVMTRTRPGRFFAARLFRVRIAPGWKVGESPEAAVQRIDVPLAIVHGRGDRLLAAMHAQLLHDSAGGPARLDLVEGMGHGIDESCRTATLEAVDWVLGQSDPLCPDAVPAPAPA